MRVLLKLKTVRLSPRLPRPSSNRLPVSVAGTGPPRL